MRLVWVAVSVLAASVIGCGSWKRVGSEEQPRPTETLTRLLNTTQFYERLGRLAAGDPMPFVGTVAFAAGPGDSVFAVLGLSLENRAFAFQREGNSFVARYRVGVSFKRDGAPPVDLAREELVRVATFQETQRADESVLFQQVLRLVPGTYKVTISVRDASSTAESSATGEYTAPKYGTATYSAPVLTYQATGRGSRADPLGLVLNPRGAVGYGSDTLLAYVEGYGFRGPTTVPFKVLDEQNNTIYDDSLRFRGGREVESQVVRLAPDSVSLGELEIVVGSDPERSTSALVSFTQAWVVTNFDEMLDLLRYFGQDDSPLVAVDGVPGWFPTGDVAHIDPDGYMQITDRSKDVIKSGGEWISSIDLENIAVAHPAVLEAAAIAVKSVKWDERPLLVVVRKPGASLTREELLAFFQGKIARWQVPDDVVFVAELPHTATGKIQKLRLREQFAQHTLPPTA